MFLEAVEPRNNGPMNNTRSKLIAQSAGLGVALLTFHFTVMAAESVRVRSVSGNPTVRELAIEAPPGSPLYGDGHHSSISLSVPDQFEPGKPWGGCLLDSDDIAGHNLTLIAGARFGNKSGSTGPIGARSRANVGPGHKVR